MLTVSKIHGCHLLRKSLYKHGLIMWCILETQQIGKSIIRHWFFLTFHFIKLKVFFYISFCYIIGLKMHMWDWRGLLHDSMRDLCSYWNAMNDMFVLQHMTIKVSFQKNINVVEQKFNSLIYKKLCNFVPREAQDLLFHELQQVAQRRY